MSVASGIGLRVAVLAAASLPLPLWAATCKCTVDGKTVYQQAPCEAGAASKTLRIQTTPNTGFMSAGQAAAARQQVQREGVVLARDGFER